MTQCLPDSMLLRSCRRFWRSSMPEQGSDGAVKMVDPHPALSATMPVCSCKMASLLLPITFCSFLPTAPWQITKVCADQRCLPYTAWHPHAAALLHTDGLCACMQPIRACTQP